MATERLKSYMQCNLRSVQQKELDILREIHKVCERNGLEYWLDGGTILGAVRHGGFIPWDDDIDIAMRREDLPRFVEAAQRELPEWLYVQTPATDPTRLPMVKVRDTNSFLVEPTDDFTQSYSKGLFVDIFPFEPYPDVSRSFCRHITKGYCTANGVLHAKHYYSLRSIVELPWFSLKRFFFRIVWRLTCKLKGVGKYYGNTLDTNGYGIYHRNTDIFPTTTILFEGEEFRAPANPLTYARNIYGDDFMQLPPPDNRKVHAVFYAPIVDESAL